MALLASLKASRERQPGPQPWPWTPWAAVAAIVQAYGLTTVDQLEAARPNFARSRERLSLYPLLTPAQYELVQAILSRHQNPYLSYAQTPADIVLSGRLYERCPDLEPELLARMPLAELWQQVEAAGAG